MIVFPSNLLTRDNRAVAKPITKRTLLFDSPAVRLICGHLSQDQLTATPVACCSNPVSSHGHMPYSCMGLQCAKRFNTAVRRLTAGIRSEKCVVRRFGRCANVIECTYTNLDSTV